MVVKTAPNKSMRNLIRSVKVRCKVERGGEGGIVRKED